LKKGREIMKKLVTKGFVTAGLLLMMIVAGVSAQAQSLQYRLTANIPFDFTVADQKFPAGKYWISRASESNGDTVLKISSTDGRLTVSRFSIPVPTFTPKNEGSVVFHRYGDDYFLSEIWPAGGTTGRALPKTHAERDVQRKALENTIGAVKTPKPDVVTVVLTIR
jgi:hypothetical protein